MRPENNATLRKSQRVYTSRKSKLSNVFDGPDCEYAVALRPENTLGSWDICKLGRW